MKQLLRFCAGLALVCSMQVPVYAQFEYEPTSVTLGDVSQQQFLAVASIVQNNLNFGRVSRLQAAVDESGHTTVLGTVDLGNLQQRKFLMRFKANGELNDEYGQVIPGTDIQYYVLPAVDMPVVQQYNSIVVNAIIPELELVSESHRLTINENTGAITSESLDQNNISAALIDGDAVYGATCSYSESAASTFNLFKDDLENDANGISVTTTDFVGVPDVIAQDATKIYVAGRAQADGSLEVFDQIFLSSHDADASGEKNDLSQIARVDVEFDTYFSTPTITSQTIWHGLWSDEKFGVVGTFTDDNDAQHVWLAHNAVTAAGTTNAIALAIPESVSGENPTFDTAHLISNATTEGETNVYGAGTHANATKLWVAAYKFSGGLNTNFGTDGFTEIDLSADMTELVCDDITIDKNGNLHVVGHGVRNGESQVFVVKLGSDGSFNTSFGEQSAE